VLQPLHEPEDLPIRAQGARSRRRRWCRRAWRCARRSRRRDRDAGAGAGQLPLNEPLSLKTLLAHRDVLMRLKLRLPDGRVLRYAGVREFGR
jgi:hypothetical protein